ncbi:MAG: hypothetical protein Q7J85_07500 [Bacillota bacterium]|nr:hypothetical protein [Bacillota bacterium]
MMDRETSKGKCYLCNGTFSKSGMTRHLQACLEENVTAAAREAAGKKAKTQDHLHVQVEGCQSPQYWMHLLMPTTTTLQKLDSFLRHIWLECCGHLSAFNIRGESYSIEPDGDDDTRDMRYPLNRVVQAGEYFTYEYDFGSTTELTLRIVKQVKKHSMGDEIFVLARNDEPRYKCDCCDKIAVEVCSECINDGEGWLCEECACGHECGEEMLLPVVNSPRVGICAYMG